MRRLYSLRRKTAEWTQLGGVYAIRSEEGHLLLHKAPAAIMLTPQETAKLADFLAGQQPARMYPPAPYAGALGEEWDPA